MISSYHIYVNNICTLLEY